MKVTDLSTLECNAYYETYTNKVSKDIALIDGFIDAKNSVVDFFKSIPEHKLEYQYASDKWSIKEILQHIIDTERVFMYRCFRIARHDTTPLADLSKTILLIPQTLIKKH